MSYLIVCPLAEIAAMAARYHPSHMVSLVSADTDVVRPEGIGPQNHLFLPMNDITYSQPELVSPETRHVQALIDFAKSWAHHPAQQPLLIHCWLGISRSTAAGFIIACALSPERCEQDIADYLRDQAPFATPNARLVALADGWLARQGRMITAIKQIGRGAEASCGKPFILNYGT